MPILAAKHCIMQANAEFHQSIMAKQKKCFGEEIARLQVSEILYWCKCLELEQTQKKTVQP